VNVRAALTQQRAAIDRTIRDNPVDLVLTRYPLVDNGTDKLVRDPSGVPTDYRVQGRLAPQRLGVQTPTGSAAGLATADEHFLLVRHDAEIVEADEFEYNERRWRVGPVEDVYRYGGVAARQAPVYRGDEV
jgi:hypothetical protein